MPEKTNMFQAPNGESSMSRIFAFIGFVVGAIVVAVGVVLAFSGAFSIPVNKDITAAGKDIIVAGIGVFTAAGVTKIGNGIAEAIRFRK